MGKRRPFIIVSGILTCLSMVGVAYAKEIGLAGAKLFESDPEAIKKMVRITRNHLTQKDSLTLFIVHRLIQMLLLLQLLLSISSISH